MSESPIRVCLNLIAAISGTQTVEEIYAAALDALAEGLQVSRASILLFDPDGVMRFKAWRGLSDEYRGAVEGHTPWTPDSPDPQPITVTDVAADPTLGEYHPIFRRERIAALAFIPLVSLGRVIGKFMLYYPAPHVFTDDELQLAALVASQVAFAVERTRAEEAARRSEERLRFALDAAEMGTWDWDLARNTVHWSDNLARIHGLPPESFDGTFASYEKEIHPDDRERVLSSIRHAIEAGAQHDVEYRLVAPDGTIRWAEGKGRVDRENDRPVRMSGICMIVTRRKEAELARLESAHEVARQKDEFLAVLSHELRTPLNAILGWLHILQHTPERLPEVLEIIGRNARQQAQLIEEILDVSRIITGKLELERSPVALQHVLQDAVRAAEPLAQARDIRLMADVPAPVATVDGDARRLRQVFDNVIGNAIKFSEPGGRVSVHAAVTAAGARVEVADAGFGIAPDILPFVFDRFRQGDSRTTRRHGGLGLGLAIARHLVEEHGGSIRAESEGHGRGTTVVVELPLVTLAGPSGMTAPDAPPASAVGSLTVLVVDDHSDSREFLHELLAGTVARVEEAASAAEALAIMERIPVHLVMADLAMPDVDGYALIHEIRLRHGGVPVVAVSALARPEDREHAQAAGFDDFQTKPVHADRLLAAVRQLAATYVASDSFLKR
ncbi:hypothetical protein BH23ACI1_BH23ACI1_29610 [soil metagenome]